MPLFTYVNVCVYILFCMFVATRTNLILYHSCNLWLKPLADLSDVVWRLNNVSNLSSTRGCAGAATLILSVVAVMLTCLLLSWTSLCVYRFWFFVIMLMCFLFIFMMVSSPGVWRFLPSKENDPHCLCVTCRGYSCRNVRNAAIGVTIAAIVCLFACRYRRSLSAAVVCVD